MRIWLKRFLWVLLFSTAAAIGFGSPSSAAAQGDMPQLPPWLNDLPQADVWKAEYWGNVNLAGAPLVTQFISSAYIYAFESPAPGIDADNWAARLSSNIVFPGGPALVYAGGSNGGIRLFIDGVLVADHWLSQPYIGDEVIINLAAGSHSIVVEYFNSSADAYVFAGYTITEGTLAGRVFEADHTTPIGSATVSLYRRGNNGNYNLFDTVVTDSTGRYSVSVLVGDYKLSADAGGYITEWMSGKPTFNDANSYGLYGPNTINNLNFTLDQPGRIAGFVRTSTGLPVANATVEAFGRNYLGSYVGSVGQAITGDDGGYSITVPPGSYTVVASAMNYAQQFFDQQPTIATAIPVTIASGQQRTNVHFALLALGSITGQVTRQGTTTPLTDAVVSAYGYDYAGSYVGAVANTGTDADGRYELLLPPGNYRIGATSSGYAPEFFDEQPSISGAQPLTLGAGASLADIDLTLQRYGVVRGRLYAGDGRTPLQGAIISFFGGEYVGSYAGSTTQAFTQGDGTFEVSLPPGSYRFGMTALPEIPVGVSAAQMETAWFFDGAPALDSSDAVTIENDALYNGLNIVVGAGETTGHLFMTVPMQGRGAAPGEAFVRSVSVRVRRVGVLEPVIDGQFATDENGDAFIGYLPPGQYTVRVKAATTLAGVVDVDVTAGDLLVSGALLREGDADDNNVVNIIDFSILAASFGRGTGMVGFDARADFDANGVVNITDFSLLAANFGLEGVR